MRSGEQTGADGREKTTGFKTKIDYVRTIHSSSSKFVAFLPQIGRLGTSLMVK